MNRLFSRHLCLCLVLFLAGIGICGCPTGGDEGEPEAEREAEREPTTDGEGTLGETEAVILPGEVPLTMVWIEPGTFAFGGSSGKQYGESTRPSKHSVTLSSGFWLGKYEVTKRQWEAVMGPRGWSDDPQNPANISWEEAQDFIETVNALSGKTFRLPSEAEWEYACRAGTTTRFYWGDDPDETEIDDYAWFLGSEDAYEEQPVGRKLPNAWGLYDMSGNASEWCEDDWHRNPHDGPSNGSAWIDSPRGEYRVLRGGNHENDADGCGSASRSYTSPSSTGYYGYSYYGFRLAR